MARERDEPVRLTRIYTRGGDGGETSLGDGSRVSKLDPLVRAYGEVDELNSLLGLGAGRGAATSGWRGSRTSSSTWAPTCRCRGSRATGGSGSSRRRSTGSRPTATRRTRALPELRSFVLPGGTEAAARLHVARAVCRRAEREVLAVAAERAAEPARRRCT